MPTVFQTQDRSGRPHRNWRFKFIDYTGKRKTKTGLPSKTETEKLAWKLQAEHDEIRKGLRPAPKESEKKQLLAERIEEYLAWGASQGGHGGYPWSKEHLSSRRRNLRFWQKRLGIVFLHELSGSLPRVEEALREKQNAGRKGKTLQNIVEALGAFCDWAVKRSYLDLDPLKNLQKFNVTPTSSRRAPTVEEIRALLAVAKPEYRLLYLVAIASGLRAGELRCLRVRHLDLEHHGFALEAGWTKGRKASFQPLHPTIVRELADSSLGKTPDDFLLSVPRGTAKALYRDLEKINVPKLTAEGRLDFHALRVGFVTFVLEADANSKEAQALARHATPDLTLNIYAKTRSQRLSGIANKVGDVVLGHSECPTVVQRGETPIIQNTAKPDATATCDIQTGQCSAGSIPDRAHNPTAFKVGLQQATEGLNPAQLGHLQGVGLGDAAACRTAGALSTTLIGRERCPTVVQRGTNRFAALLTENAGLELSYETKLTPTASRARRWYAQQLLARISAA